MRIVVPWPTSSQTALSHTRSVCPTYHVSQYTMNSFPTISAWNLPLWKLFLSAVSHLLKLSALMASADSDATALTVWATRWHKVYLACQGPYDWFKESMGCSCMILLVPTIFIASLPKSAFSMRSSIGAHGSHIPCTIAIALKAFPPINTREN